MNNYIAGGILGGLSNIAKTFKNVKLMEYQKAENEKQKVLNYLKTIAPSLKDKNQLYEIARTYDIPDKEVKLFEPIIGTNVQERITPEFLMKLSELKKTNPEQAKALIGSFALRSKNPSGTYNVLASITTPESVARFKEMREEAFKTVPKISKDLAKPLINMLESNGIIDEIDRNYLEKVAGTGYKPPEYATKQKIDIWKTNPDFAKELKLPKGSKLTVDQYITKLNAWQKEKESKYKHKSDYWYRVYNIRKDAYNQFLKSVQDKYTGEIKDEGLRKYREYFLNPDKYDEKEVAEIMQYPLVQQYLKLKKALEDARKNLVQTQPDELGNEYKKIFDPLVKMSQDLLKENIK